MPLKAFVANLDALPEPLREFYKQQEDGRYKFDAEDVEDVGGLKSALQHERDERKSAKETLAELREKFDGVDPELARKLITEHEKGQRKQMIDQDRVEELIESETQKRVKKMHETHEAALAELTGERDTLRGRLEVVLIDNQLSTEAAKAGVLAEALPDVVRRGRERFHLNGDKVVAKDGEGNILYGADGQTSQSVTEFMDELKSQARHLFAPSKGGGATRSFNSGASGAATGTDNVRGVSRMRRAREQQHP